MHTDKAYVTADLGTDGERLGARARGQTNGIGLCARDLERLGHGPNVDTGTKPINRARSSSPSGLTTATQRETSRDGASDVPMQKAWSRRSREVARSGPKLDRPRRQRRWKCPLLQTATTRRARLTMA